MIKSLYKIVALCLIISIFLSLNLISGSASGESGTPISTKEEFYNIRNNLSGNYYLTRDIEFSTSDFAAGGTYYNSGKYFLPIGDGKNPFKGTFDGRGFTVSGIKISISGQVYSMNVTPVATGIMTADDWTGDYIIDPTPKPSTTPTAGVFGSNQGTIKNLNISDCSISARSSNSATLYVGGIAAHNGGNISNCSVKNTLNCDSRSYIGGIVGYQSAGSVTNCLVRGKIESDGTYGSVVGAVAGGKVTNCLSVVQFTGDKAASVKLAGVDVLNNIANCYYKSDEECDGIGISVSSLNIKNPLSYSGFDFSDNWYMSGTLRHPALKGVGISEGSDITTGDLDADGTKNLLDLVLLARYVAKWNIEIHKEVANVNFDFTSDGEDIVDLADVTHLAQNLAGWNNAVLY